MATSTTAATAAANWALRCTAGTDRATRSTPSGGGAGPKPAAVTAGASRYATGWRSAGGTASGVWFTGGPSGGSRMSGSSAVTVKSGIRRGGESASCADAGQGSASAATSAGSTAAARNLAATAARRAGARGAGGGALAWCTLAAPADE